MPSICFFVPLLTTWSISTNFSNLPQHKIWRKFVQWELSCSMRAYGRPDIPTDRHDHATSRFSEVWERASEATKPTSAHVWRNASVLLQPCCPGDRFTRYRLPNKASVAHRSHFPVKIPPTAWLQTKGTEKAHAWYTRLYILMYCTNDKHIRAAVLSSELSRHTSRSQKCVAGVVTRIRAVWPTNRVSIPTRDKALTRSRPATGLNGHRGLFRRV